MEIEGTYFEWDTNKNLSNLSKHGIDLEAAIGVFFDENALIQVDERSYQNEVRYQTIGVAGARLLFVVYVERGDNTIRLISARLANRRERKMYVQSSR